MTVAGMVFAGSVGMLLKYAYPPDNDGPIQSFVGTVTKLNNEIVSDAWNGTRGFCSVTIQVTAGEQITANPYWRNCTTIAVGDRVQLWRQQYGKNADLMVGQWKDWNLVPSAEIAGR